MIVLDTNVVAELMRPKPSPQVVAWADGLDPEAVTITAMNETEILHGLARTPDGRCKQELPLRWDALLQALFPGRAWAFNSDAAHWYAQLLSRRERMGKPIASTKAPAQGPPGWQCTPAGNSWGAGPGWGSRPW